MPEIADFAQTVEFRLLILAFLVLAGPIIAERLRIPGLVGLIFLGLAFGPFALGLVVPGGLVEVIGAIGLLYLMFLAGIELDLNTFMANRKVSITFGLLTFAIPFGLSLAAAVFYLGYTDIAAIALIGALWASHTVVAYPEVKAAGLETNRAVGFAVSATVITDVLALAILGFAAAEPTGTEGAEGHIAVVPVWIGVFILAGFCLWVLPKVTNWFFVNLGRTRVQRFVWTLGGMAAGAFVGLLGGMEGLVGAFLAGIGINRLIPRSGQLMERIEFFGAALFVPAFLISVGLSIDPAALTDTSTLGLAGVFIAVVLGGKALAATVAGKIFGLSWAEIGMMSSLTIGQAAATLAISQVGVSTGLFSQDVLNAAVLVVVVMTVITSVGTRFFARRIEPPAADTESIGARILLRVPPTGDIDGAIAVGVAVARKDSGLLTPFIVCEDDERDARSGRLESAVQGAIDRGQDSEGVTRIASSQVEGALNLAAETEASMFLLPWSGPRFPGNLFFGDAIDDIGERSPIPAVAARVIDEEWSRILYFQGRTKNLYARNQDAGLALDVARRVAAHADLELVVYATNPTVLEDQEDIETIHRYSARGASALDTITEGDLVVVPVHVAEDALGLGAVRLTRSLSSTSLLIVAGPHRLHISTRLYADNVYGGAAFSGRRRERIQTPR